MDKQRFVCLCAAVGAFLLSSAGLFAQELVSLDEWVKAEGLTPTIDGGTSGTQYHRDYGPAVAFNGVTYSSNNGFERWLGSIQNSTYLKYGLPDALTRQFSVKGYRLHSLSLKDFNEARAPRSWAIYGHENASAAANDAGWVLVDEQADVQWPFETGGYDESIPATKYVLEFTLANPVTYRAYKFVPLSSMRTTSDPWTTGLMELIYLGNESTDGYVIVQGSPGDSFEFLPAYGMIPNLPAGTNVTFTAPAVGYADSIRYRCAGYVLEKLDADGAWVLDGTNFNVNSYAYVGDGSGQRLTWLWEEDGYALTAGLEFAGTESVTVSPEPEADGYYTAGTEVTLTPAVPDGTESRFKNWYGDVPEGAEYDIPLTVTMDAAKTVYAHFRRPWSVVPDTTYQITDGNWTLRLSVADDGTCGLGIDADYQAPLAGSGILDLTDVEMDTGFRLVRVEAYAFEKSADLVELMLPDSITLIRDSAFRECTGLRAVQLPTALESIYYSAFRDATSLQTVTPLLPSTLTNLSANAFQNCTSLTGDLVLSNPAFRNVMNTAFGKCSSLTSVDLTGSGATIVNEWTFSGCTSLTNAVLGEKIKTIALRAFNGCTALENVVAGPELQEIRDNAFVGCSSLRTFTPFLPDSLTTLGPSSFQNCTSLTGDLKLNCPGLTTVGGNAFNHAKLTSVDMSGSGITNLQYYCFNGNVDASLTNVVLPSGLTTIGTYVFGWNYGLTTVTPFLPETVTSIGQGAFIQNTKLTGELEITNPAFTSVGTYAFQNTALTKVTLPNTAFTIGNYTFQDVDISTPVYFLGQAPASIGTQAFSTGDAWRNLYVCRRVDSEGWAAYTSALTDEDRAAESFPGRAAFGVLNANNSRVHWLLHWNSPYSDNPDVIIFR